MKINWTLIWQEFDALASEDEGDWEFHLTHEERKAVEKLVNRQLNDLQKAKSVPRRTASDWDPRGHY